MRDEIVRHSLRSLDRSRAATAPRASTWPVARLTRSARAGQN